MKHLTKQEMLQIQNALQLIDNLERCINHINEYPDTMRPLRISALAAAIDESISLERVSVSLLETVGAKDHQFANEFGKLAVTFHDEFHAYVEANVDMHQ